MIFDLALLGSMTGSFLIAGDKPKTRIAASIIWFIANCLWFTGSYADGNIRECFMWIFYNGMCILTFYNNYKLIKKQNGNQKK